MSQAVHARAYARLPSLRDPKTVAGVREAPKRYGYEPLTEVAGPAQPARAVDEPRAVSSVPRRTDAQG